MAAEALHLPPVLAPLLTPISILKSASLNPLITGPLLLVLLRNPVGLRDKLLQQLSTHTNFASGANGPRRIATAVRTLKWLFAIGVVKHIDKILTRLALNHWHWTPQGEPWRFGSGKDGETPKTDEIVLITGGCSGFGYHMVKGFAGRARIIVLDISELPEELKSIPNIHHIRADLSSPAAQLIPILNTIKTSIGHPSVLINNAGIGTSQTILSARPEYLQKIFQINLLSHWTLIQAFLPQMLESRKGHIVSIASMASFGTAANLADYAATKSGVLSLHEGLNQELRYRYPNGHCIRTTIVHPMWARTGIIKTWEKALDASGQRIMRPEVVAEAVVKQVLEGKSGGIYLPEADKIVTVMRAFPVWLQEFGRGSVQMATRAEGY